MVVRSSVLSSRVGNGAVHRSLDGRATRASPSPAFLGASAFLRWCGALRDPRDAVRSGELAPESALRGALRTPGRVSARVDPLSLECWSWRSVKLLSRASTRPAHSSHTDDQYPPYSRQLTPHEAPPPLHKTTPPPSSPPDTHPPPHPPPPPPTLSPLPSSPFRPPSPSPPTLPPPPPTPPPHPSSIAYPRSPVPGRVLRGHVDGVQRDAADPGAHATPIPTSSRARTGPGSARFSPAEPLTSPPPRPPGQ